MIIIFFYTLVTQPNIWVIGICAKLEANKCFSITPVKIIFQIGIICETSKTGTSSQN